MALWLEDNGTTPQYLLRPGMPFTGYPYTIGAWIKPTTNDATRNHILYCFGLAAGTPAPIMQLRYDNGSGLGFGWSSANGGGGGGDQDIACQAFGDPFNWFYVIYRGIDINNNFLAVMNPDGSIAQGSYGVGYTFTTDDQFVIGALSFNAGIDGGGSGGNMHIAEFFITNTDISGAASPANMTAESIRYLAYNGPWAIPMIANNVVDYLPLLNNKGFNVGKAGEDFTIKGNPSGLYKAVGGPIITPHPQRLISGYRRPNDDPVIRIV